MEKRDRLGLAEFSEVLWENISPKVVTNTYINRYDEFITQLNFDAWNQYYTSEETISIKVFSRMVESFFYNLFHFDSSSEYVNEEIELK